MKMTVFWDVALCSLVETNRRFRDTHCLHYQGDDGGSKHLLNVGQFLRDYMAQHPTRQSSSATTYRGPL
jgi:hypothetical protein